MTTRKSSKKATVSNEKDVDLNEKVEVTTEVETLKPVESVVNTSKEDKIDELNSQITRLNDDINEQRHRLTELKKELRKLTHGEKEGGPTKMDKAKAIFEQMKGQPRKDILKAFIDEAGLTKSGANTYYFILNKK